MSLPEPDSTPQTPPEAPAPTPVLTGAPPPSALDVPPRYGAGEWALFALGAVLAIVSIGIAVLGVLIPIVLFAANRPPRPPIVRGMGLGLIILGVLLLGAFGVCLVLLGVTPYSGSRTP